MVEGFVVNLKHFARFNRKLGFLEILKKMGFF